MAKKSVKTNAVRLLDRAKINYELREYPEHDGPIAAVEVADYFHQPADRIFKTLVTTDTNKGYFVFCLPGDHSLDLKKAAKIVGVKKLEMLKQKDLLPLTGYVHGGCSPIGMKKVFPTVIDKSALDWETIYMSGGKIGLQIEVYVKDLENLIDITYDEITKD